MLPSLAFLLATSLTLTLILAGLTYKKPDIPADCQKGFHAINFQNMNSFNPFRDCQPNFNHCKVYDHQVYQECKKCEHGADLVFDREQGNWCAVSFVTWVYVSPLVWGAMWVLLTGVFEGVVRVMFRREGGGEGEGEGEGVVMGKVE